jgi:hypothetical protein
MNLYAICKEDNKVHFICPNKQNLDIMMEQAKVDINDYIILQEFNMNYVSRITYIDGVCVYNNKEYWTKTAVLNPITEENFNEHEIKDFLGNDVTYDRYVDEYNNNISRLSSIDGVAGEVEYNIEVGDEFISLFREECVKTDFKSITPLEIAQKLAPIISLVQTGSFREAKQVLQTIENDQFLTPARVQKYIDMMDSADAIEYATEEDFYYTASNNV